MHNATEFTFRELNRFDEINLLTQTPITILEHQFRKGSVCWKANMMPQKLSAQICKRCQGLQK